MKLALRERLNRLDRMSALLSMLLLLVYIYYTWSFVFSLPYSQLVLSSTTSGWRVADSGHPEIQTNDLLLAIGGLTFEEYRLDRRRIPLGGYSAGDTVTVLVGAEGRPVALHLADPTLLDRLKRLLNTVTFFPFWLAGTAVLLFLRPRDLRWRLLVAFMYTIAIWVLVGVLSSWRIGGSRIILGAVSFLMIPIFLHLHLLVPTAMAPRQAPRLLLLLYVVATGLAILEILQILPQELPLYGLAVAIFGSVGLLLYRYFSHSSTTPERIAARLMLLGLGLSFGPGLAFVVLPQLIQASIPGVIGFSVALLAIPVLPLFYVYAIYKRQLAALEFRANRLLSLYSFALLYPPAFLLLLLWGNQRIESPSGRMSYLLLTSIAFVLATPALLSRFHRWLNRLAYGTEHDPQDLLQLFAQRIPSVLSRDALSELMTGSISRSLLIRQSGLFLYEAADGIALFAQGISKQEVAQAAGRLERTQQEFGTFRFPVESSDTAADWVHLAIPIKQKNQLIALWLFGKRDPDDFYPQDDIDLLQSLANQIAPVLQNIWLYEALQHQANSLAEQVGTRTTELRAERDRTQAILDSAGEGIFFVDAAGTILYVNPALAQLTGYTNEMTLGQSIDLWRPAGSATEPFEILWSAIRSGRGWSGELELQRHNGTLYDAHLTIAPIRASEDEATGFVGIQSDVTQTKEVDRLKSNIISNVSHELKTPLTNIRMYLDLLERGREEKKGEYWTVLNRETERLMLLVQDLLDLSQLDSGSVATRFEPVLLKPIIDYALHSCSARAEQKQIRLEVDTPDNLPPIVADAKQIEQVMKNLLVNAINYTPQGGCVSVTAGMSNGTAETSAWFCVRDSGPGISADEVPHIFERFYRGRAGQQSHAPGTGLGLSICQEIVARHHGSIDVESIPGQGSAFTVRLETAESKS
jgi:PAS domain S-box-containing protein